MLTIPVTSVRVNSSSDALAAVPTVVTKLEPVESNVASTHIHLTHVVDPSVTHISPETFIGVE